MIYTCCDKNRRAAVDEHSTLNGIDWLEVVDQDAPTDRLRQNFLFLRLIKTVPAAFVSDNVRIEGGERLRNIYVKQVARILATDIANLFDENEDPVTGSENDFFLNQPEPDHLLIVRTNTAGDFSTYYLHLVQGNDNDAPPPNFDPRLSTIDFAFKVECPSDFDCMPQHNCQESPKPAPDINYLARDYASLRRMVIDRLTRRMPEWRDRSPADLGTTLAELIAYVGDHQHYQLDAISTEAYLHTARRRCSLRRHVLLVDYAMHEGCNARAWLHVHVNGGPFTLDPANMRCYTRVPGVPPRMLPDSFDERTALQAAPLKFEPMHQATLRVEHNDFTFYTWGDNRCCLPVGTTKAFLCGHWPHLKIGNVLIFQETMGPLTDKTEDADPTHRHAVRLADVCAFDGSEPLIDPLNDTQITEIRWHAGDALPFPLCLSSETDEAHSSMLIENVSIALGNIILIDHGLTIANEALGSVPKPDLHFPPVAGDPCRRAASEPLPPRFRPKLAHGQVTHQGQILKTTIEDGLRRSERLLFDPEASAGAAFSWRLADAVPAIILENTPNISTEHWNSRHNLLASRATDRHFVLESEDDGSTRLRFGDDQHGRRPDTGTAFTATYRVGNGPAGNVGANTIVHAVTTEGRIESISNPLPADGGMPPETTAEVRRHAPHAFRTQERAVTPADYAEVTERLDGVQRAAAGLRWTGSWHTVFVTVDREGGEPVDAPFTTTVVEHLDQYRMAGYDLHINDPIAVSLEIDMHVCVDPAYFRSEVRQSLLDVFSIRFRADGTRGVFHADNFSFGKTVFLSPFYAAARQVAGVASVQVTRFHRQGRKDPKPLAEGFMTLGRLEIPRLDNDPNFPEHGVLRLNMQGGK